MDLAEELAQETFLRAARSILGWNGASPVGWLLAIARNVHLDHARRARRVVAWDDALLDRVDAPPEPLDDSRVSAVLVRLPIGARRLLELVYFDGFTPTEVAAMTGAAPGTVRMSLMRARVAFGAAWVEDAAGEQP